MKEFKKLWDNRKDPQGRINITLFFINILLVMVHVFFMFVYISLNHTLMITLNIFSLLIYTLFIFRCYKNVKFYITVTAIEIWIHMLFAVMSFGWDAAFQNWSFATITAVFLPVYGNQAEDKLTKESYIYSLIVIISYFLFAFAGFEINFAYRIDLTQNMERLMFIANNIIVFFSTIMLATFYTSTNKRTQKDLSRKADFDELTNIYNRHAIQHIANVLIHTSVETNRPFHVAILDIDYFKKVNDTYGHGSGDLVLKKLASILRQFATKGVFAARWGGEEFVLICAPSHDYKYFTDQLEKLRAKVNKTKFTIEDGKKIDVHISIGAASIKDDCTLEDAVVLADERLYRAKETGRNKLVIK